MAAPRRALGRLDAQGALRDAGRRTRLPRTPAVGAHAFLLRRRTHRSARPQGQQLPHGQGGDVRQARRPVARRRTSIASTARKPMPPRPPPTTGARSAAFAGHGPAALRPDPAGHGAGGAHGVDLSRHDAACAKPRRSSSVFVEKMATYRVTFTPPLLNNAKAILFLVAGQGQGRHARRRARRPDRTRPLPAQGINAYPAKRSGCSTRRRVRSLRRRSKGAPFPAALPPLKTPAVCPRPSVAHARFPPASARPRQ